MFNDSAESLTDLASPFLQPQNSTHRLRRKVIALRKQNLSIYDISQALRREAEPLSPVAVSLILKQEGFRILDEAKVASVSEAAVVVFVGTEFDSITGRGGDDGTPLRKTPWGEIAWQLCGEAGFAAVAEHDRQFVEPKGDVIQAFLPKDKPSLILMDEVINYTSTYRHKGYHRTLYNFIQSLSEQARGSDNPYPLHRKLSVPATSSKPTEPRRPRLQAAPALPKPQSPARARKTFNCPSRRRPQRFDGPARFRLRSG
jgi:hypothetical protein